jgi:glutamate synthase (NADPH/NADH) small chain
MDAARCARRLGAEEVSIVYRRGMKELPARLEEVHHAQEEGITFRMLTNPLQVLGDERGWVKGLECIRMTLGEPDDSGRRRPIEEAGSNYELAADVVIIAIGTSSNPLIRLTTPGLETDQWGCIRTNGTDGLTSRERVFAGGDVVTGSATVILAMGAAKDAALAIDRLIKDGKKTQGSVK